MIKGFYQESIFCREWNQEFMAQIEHKIQLLLAQNNGVGVVGGSYAPGLPITLVSELALNALGYANVEQFQRRTAMLFTNCLSAKDRALQDVETFRRFTGEKILALPTQRGEERWFRLCKGDQTLPDGEKIWLLTISDCDARQNRELDLIEERDTAEAASRAKSNFLSGVSHDIRTPLNSILGMAHIASEHADDPEIVRESLEKLIAAGEQLESLINDILDMSRLESGKVELLHQPFDLYSLLSSIGDSLHAQSEKMQLKIGLHFNMTHRHVIGNPLHVQHIIANISSNAVKYNHVGGLLDYTLEEFPIDATHATYRFTIRDTGIGMSEKFLTHLYEPYSRANTADPEHYEGTGLGMSITLELVKKMNGTIQVQSQLGKGTTFTVDLPLELDTEACATKDNTVSNSTELPELPNLQGMHILLAEDNDLNREIAEYILTGAGAAVTSARNGRQAVALFEASGQGSVPVFDAILMDIVMPEMDGLQAARAIRASAHPGAATVPIVAQSANAFADDVRKSSEAGMNGYVTKPLDETRLLRELAQYKK